MRFREIFACVALAPMLIAAGQSIRLQPSSPWVLNYDEENCKLTRNFGTAADLTTLQFESATPYSLSMVAAGRQLWAPASVDKVPTRFLPGQEDNPFVGTPAMSEGRTAAVTWFSVPLIRVMNERNASTLPQSIRDRMALAVSNAAKGIRPPPIDLAEKAAALADRQAFATKVSSLQIEARKDHPVILETGSLGEPIKMLDQCIRDQLQYWGIDPKLEDKIVRPVWAPRPASWFTDRDYPSMMLNQLQESEVRVRLLVDATGHATKCTSLSNFRTPEAAKAVCAAFLRRSRFSPAELADGTKVPSYYTSGVRFKLGY